MVCSEGSPCAPGFQFRVLSDGSVEATFDCPNRLQGYPDCLHGGVISSLLDGATANCLFAHRIVAVQPNAEGGLSEQAWRRATKLADDADVRLSPRQRDAFHTGSSRCPSGTLVDVRLCPYATSHTPSDPQMNGRTTRAVFINHGAYPQWANQPMRS